jgi:hypothetical protein
MNERENEKVERVKREGKEKKILSTTIATKILLIVNRYRHVREAPLPQLLDLRSGL